MADLIPFIEKIELSLPGVKIFDSSAVGGRSFFREMIRDGLWVMR